MRSRHGTEAHRWTAAEKEFLAEFVSGRSYLEVRDELERRFGTKVTVYAVKGIISRLGLRNGLSTRFGVGSVPANKGKTWDEMGISPEAQAKSRATCFKTGEEPINGAAVPIGTERVGKDGYIQVKVKRFSDRPGANKCWRSKQSLIWEGANGQPVPEGSVIAFADRDKRNFDPENLVCVPRDLLGVMSKAGLSYFDRESLKTAMLAAQLIRAARDKELSERVCTACGRTYKPYYPRQQKCRACIDAKRRAKRWENPDYFDPPDDVWAWLEDCERMQAELVDAAVSTAVARGAKTAQVTYYRSQDQYDLLGGAPGPFGVANANARMVAQRLKGLKVAVDFCYPDDDGNMSHATELPN